MMISGHMWFASVVAALLSHQSLLGADFLRIASTPGLDLQICFADPYSGWQCDTSENTNRLLRHFLLRRIHDHAGLLPHGSEHAWNNYSANDSEDDSAPLPSAVIEACSVDSSATPSSGCDGFSMLVNVQWETKNERQY
jgi:hypothetical protein